MLYHHCIIYTDGGARGNPGPAGIGVVVLDSHKKVIAEYREYIGEATNNQAEYRAVLLALAKAKDLGAREIDFYLDSELVVKQLNQEYKVKDQDLGVLFVKIWNQLPDFQRVRFSHVRREQNRRADRLVNQVIDAAGKS
ncbi:ribonuclease HI family protein [Candidatus Falkowbacteria bacterium]|nr:ribonuclease HI family protein [Candidatus Falkowbacteria bacterium]